MSRPVTVGCCHHVAIRVPQDVKDILDQQRNKSEYIINAIRNYAKEE